MISKYTPLAAELLQDFSTPMTRLGSKRFRQFQPLIRCFPGVAPPPQFLVKFSGPAGIEEEKRCTAFYDPWLSSMANGGMSGHTNGKELIDFDPRSDLSFVKVYK